MRRSKTAMMLAAGALLALTVPALANWDQTLADARGHTAYWNAWGGDQRTNDFIAWVGAQAQDRFCVKVE